MPPPVSRERIVPGLKAKLGQELQQSSKRRGESCDIMQRGGIVTPYYAYIVLGWLIRWYSTMIHVGIPTRQRGDNGDNRH